MSKLLLDIRNALAFLFIAVVTVLCVGMLLQRYGESDTPPVVTYRASVESASTD